MDDLPFLLIILCIIIIRISTGAHLPFQGKHHYNVFLPIGMVLNNMLNYFLRSIPSALVFGLLVTFPLYLYIKKCHKKDNSKFSIQMDKWILFFGFAWYFVFFLPIYPITMRSERFIYITGFGFCIVIAYLTVQLLKSLKTKKVPRFLILIGTIIYTIIFGVSITNQNTKAIKIVNFSTQFTRALQEQIPDPEKHTHFYIVTSPRPETMKLLKGAFHGYFNDIVKWIYEREDISGNLGYEKPLKNHGKIKKLSVEVAENKILFKEIK